MEVGPHNAVSDRADDFLGRIGDPDQFDAILAALADDILRDDRRRFVSTGIVDRHGYIDGLQRWFEIADGRPRWNLERVVATRGERGAVVLVSVTYGDGSRTELLVLGELDEVDGRWRRFVYFDPDDVDTALEALNHLPTDDPSA